MRRFERPDSRNRWDAPLFTVHPLLGPDHIQQQLEAAAAAIADEPGAADARVLGQRRPAKELVPTIATKQGATLLSGARPTALGALHRAGVGKCIAVRPSHDRALACLPSFRVRV